MGRPLRKLHQTHFCLRAALDICNIRTTIRFRTRRFLKHKAQGFVSKKDRLEKADRQPIRRSTS